MSGRYAETFARLAERGEGAFVPFTVLGDPDRSTSLAILRAMVDSGADALELGVPFSDPVADGPVIQRADIRALGAGGGLGGSWSLIEALRAEAPAIPIGLLVYANLVDSTGIDRFYERAAAAGVDSVLVADVPTIEADPFVAAATRHGVEPVLIAVPGDLDVHIQSVARLARGYTYVVTRAGVTGADERAATGHGALLAELTRLGAPPSLLGFGIARPEDVAGALQSGAAGAISGSAVVQRLEDHLGDRPAMIAAVADFVASMKAATRRPAQLEETAAQGEPG